MYTVRWDGRVEKELRKCPRHIQDKFHGWVSAVEYVGLAEVRKSPGYHDEPLKKEWVGFRSIRLSKAYRAIYKEKPDQKTIHVVIVRISKHDYA